MRRPSASSSPLGDARADFAVWLSSDFAESYSDYYEYVQDYCGTWRNADEPSRDPILMGSILVGLMGTAMIIAAYLCFRGTILTEVQPKVAPARLPAPSLAMRCPDLTWRALLPEPRPEEAEQALGPAEQDLRVSAGAYANGCLRAWLAFLRVPFAFLTAPVAWLAGSC